jgi:hypothetical protein
MADTGESIEKCLCDAPHLLALLIALIPLIPLVWLGRITILPCSLPLIGEGEWGVGTHRPAMLSFYPLPNLPHKGGGSIKGRELWPWLTLTSIFELAMGPLPKGNRVRAPGYAPIGGEGQHTDAPPARVRNCIITRLGLFYCGSLGGLTHRRET